MIPGFGARPFGGKGVAGIPWLRLLAIAVFWVFVSCLGGSGETETGQEISLTGRVLDKDNAGLQGVIVTLAKVGIADTTDAQGKYSLQGESPKGLDGSSVLDTVLFRQTGRIVASLPVTKWVDALPDIQIIQRDISGVLSVGKTWIAKVIGVISGDGIPADKPVEVEFFYSAPANHYSGFAYFTGSSALRNYSVAVRVEDSAGRVTGRSPVIAFNSNAGDILIPTFASDNAVPKVFAGNDTTAVFGQILRLRGSAVDSFGGAIVKWEWKIGSQDFRQVASGDTSIQIPVSDDSLLTGILRVTDDDGNTGSDTLRITTQAAGDTWTAVALGAGDYLSDLSVAPAAGAGAVRVVAVGGTDGGGRIYSSVDGRAWTLRTPDRNAEIAPASVVWAGSRWVALGDSVFTSTDGTSWNVHAALAGVSPKAAWTGTELLSIDLSGILRASADGVSWTVVDSAGKGLFGIAWGGRSGAAVRGVAVGMDGLILTTGDGRSWTPRPIGLGTGFGNALTAVQWIDTQWVALGQSGRILTSPDGLVWTSRTSGVSEDLYAVAGAPGRLVAVGANGRIVVSRDGINWSPRNSGTVQYLTTVVWTGERFVIGGYMPEILFSPP